MDSVSIKLQGGLGNYLFQIACAYAYGLKYQKEMILTENDSVAVHKHLNNYKSNILRKVKLLPTKNYKNFKKYVEPSFSYQEIPFMKGDVYLSNYFQSEKYFKEYEKEIRELFKYPTDLVKDIINKFKNNYKIDILNDNTCSIHVRRGDYVNQPQNHPTQNMNYYMKSIKRIGIENTYFLVFSDDILWCKENFPDLPNFIFVEGLKDYEDLLLMSFCKNNIICNSTFSWWAAWLNDNKNKIIIAPKKWFGPAYNHFITDDLYKEDWVLI